MAPRNLKEYGAKIGTQIYPCLVNDNIYKQPGVAAALGFVAPSETAQFTSIGSLRTLRRAGAIIKVNVTGTKVDNDPATPPRKTWRLWCVVESLATAKGALVNSSIDGYSITRVSARTTTRYR